MQKENFLYSFYSSFLVTLTLLIAVSIYFFIKYRANQKQILPFHDASIKEIDVKNVL